MKKDPLKKLKKLIIYYSLDGNTKFIAETVAKEMKADILELKTKKSLKSKGFMKYFWGGKQVVTKEKPELLHMNKNPQGYDIIIIGTPVWAGSYAPAFRTFFSKIKIVGRKIALFCCCGSNPGATFRNMRTELLGSKILNERIFIDPLKEKDKYETKVKAWVEELLQKI